MAIANKEFQLGSGQSRSNQNHSKENDNNPSISTFPASPNQNRPQDKAPATQHGGTKYNDLPDIPEADMHKVDFWAQKLKNIPYETIKKAWFSTAHFMLPPGSHVVDMGCADGAMSYAMAVMNPHLRFTAIDFDPQSVQVAKKTYRSDNLRYKTGNMQDMIFPEKSIDAIINSFILHEIYSASNYNEELVTQILNNQFRQLKDHGQIFIRDYAISDPLNMVMLEMPDIYSGSDDPKYMSDPELLEYYSDHARAGVDDNCHGFPLEELPPRYPRTRLFRLPMKWAYEFIVRNQNRDHWQDEIGKEYSFYTQRDFSRILGNLGTRVLYSAPHWNDQFINSHYMQHFRMYDDEGRQLSAPPTSYIVVARKMPDRQSLTLSERRMSKNHIGSISVQAMRNEMNGQTLGIAQPNIHQSEIIPYRIGENNSLKVMLHNDAPRPIMNTIPRQGKTLDGKAWSGHMTEAITVERDEFENKNIETADQCAQFCQSYLGVTPIKDAFFEKGPSYFPAPDFIDDRIETHYIQYHFEPASDHDIPAPFAPKYLPRDKMGFSDIGDYREFDAQDILDAIAVGLIPQSRLEMQIMRLYENLGIKPVTWAECPLVLQPAPEDAYINMKSTTEILDLIDMVDTRFKDIKGSAGDLRVIPSIFVDEGRQKGGLAGLASREMDFVIKEDKTINMAVIMPLSRSHSGEVLACVQHDYLPVPQRYNGSSGCVKLPSIELPKEVCTIEDAKRYIADKYEIGIENVAQMGEPYFSYIGVTPRRVFPFAITDCAEAGDMDWGTFYAPISTLHYMHHYSEDFLIWELSIAVLRYHSGSGEHAPARQFKNSYESAQHKDAYNLSYAGQTMSGGGTAPGGLELSSYAKKDKDKPDPTQTDIPHRRDPSAKPNDPEIK